MSEPARAGAYDLGEPLGSGGFGEVFRAKHPVIGREVAIKVLHAKYSKDAEAVARFVAEARAVNQISHPGIVEIFDFGELADGRAYCVMELIEGKTLRDVLRERTRLPLAEALPILRGIAEAIDAAHAAGIAHRDLKPDNVFVTGDGVKVIDFGLAKLTHENSAPITETGAVFGTPLYMSPEQCRGKAVTTATDAYSFGVLAYHLLVGEPPFSGEALDLALHHLNDQPAAPSTRAEGLDARVDRVVLALLAKDPAQRPRSLADAIAAIAGDATLPAMPRTPGRARWLVAGAAVLALAAGGVAVYARGCVAPSDDSGCAPAADRLATVWDANVRAQIGAKFNAAKRPDVDAAWRVLSTELDGWTTQWSKQWALACRAPDRTSDPLLYAQRLTCLDNGLIALRGITGSVADSDAVAFSEGYIGSSLLPILADCESTSVLRAQPPAPPPDKRDEVAKLVAETERSRIDLRTAINARRFSLLQGGLDRIRAAAKRLDELGVPESVEAWVWLAHHLVALANNDQTFAAEAEKAVDTAVQRAVDLRNDQWAPYAYQKAVMWQNNRGDAAKVDAAMARWRTAIDRAGHPLRPEADYAQMRANIEVGRGHVDPARAALAEFVRASERLGQPILYARIADEVRAQLEQQAHNLPEAERALRATVARETTNWGPDHRRVVSAREQLADVLAAQNKLADAIAEVRAILAADERVGAAPQELLFQWTRMATYAAQAGDRAVVEEAVGHVEKLHGDGSWMRQLVDVANSTGSLEIASYVLTLRDHLPEKLSPQNEMVLEEARAYVAFMIGDYVAIDEPARRAIALAIQLHQPTLAGAMLGVAQAKAGHAAEALAGLATQDKTIPADAPAGARVMFTAGNFINAGLVQFAAERWTDAAKSFGAGLATYHENHVRTWDVAEVEAFLGEALVRSSDPKAALEPLEESLAITAECCKGFHYYAPMTEFALARALVATGGDKARAHQLAEAARDHYARIGAHRETERQAVSRWLAEH